MKKTLLGSTLAAVVLSTLPAAAFADVAFNVGAVTDYRYRGISQTRLKPALQGGADYSNGGFYLGTWASTIKWIKDAGGDADVEIDLYGGYKFELAKGTTLDVGVLTYQYPSNKLATSANTTEVYAAFTYDIFTAKYSHSVTNLFGFADSKSSGYLDLSAAVDLGNGMTLTPHVGYQKVSHNGDYSYTDYSVTFAKDINGLVLSAALVGTDTKKLGGNYTYISPAGKNLGKATAVLGVKYNF
jgi:uncharacterized protein (TIGR02001 family)